MKEDNERKNEEEKRIMGEYGSNKPWIMTVFVDVSCHATLMF